jgi:hypothetical protein
MQTQMQTLMQTQSRLTKAQPIPGQILWER